jgi:hypothetical protein
MPRRAPAKATLNPDEEVPVSDHERDQLIADSLRQPGDDNDTTSVGHIMLRNERQHLYYLRLIEHEMPKLVGKSPINLLLRGSRIDLFPRKLSESLSFHHLRQPHLLFDPYPMLESNILQQQSEPSWPPLLDYLYGARLLFTNSNCLRGFDGRQIHLVMLA